MLLPVRYRSSIARVARHVTKPKRSKHPPQKKRTPIPRTSSAGRQTVPPKLTAPRPTRLYPRERLFKLLDHSRKDHRVIWISAPGGAGKTSLVASYLQARKIKPLWYQVDSGDGDVASFFYYLGLAAQHAAPRHKKPLPVLTPEYLADVPTFARNFFRELYRRLPTNSVIVLDNYQDAPEASQLHDVLHTAMHEVPEDLNLMVLSRIEPPAVLARLRLCDHAACLNWDKIQLTAEETAGMSAIRLGNQLDANTVQQLHERAHGWAAGIVLMLEQAHGKGGTPDLTNLPTDQKLLFDYFASELLARSDPGEQEFLIKTALLPKISVSAARALTGNERSAEILENLVRRNYFTTRHQGEPPTYEYHPLFREFLRSRANETLNPREHSALLQDAARCLEAEGQHEAAIELLLSAEDWSSAAQLIVQHATQWVEQGRGLIVLHWLTAFPKEVIAQQPWLGYWRGIAQLAYDPAASRFDLEGAYRHFKASGEETGRLLAWCAIVDSFVYEGGDFRPLDHWIAEVQDYLTGAAVFPSMEIEARFACAAFMAFMNRQLENPALPRWEQFVQNLVLHGTDHALRIQIGPHLFLYYAWYRSEFSKARTLYHALQPVMSDESAPPFVSTAWCFMSASFCWWIDGDSDQALHHAAEGLERARQSGVHVWEGFTYVVVMLASLSAQNLSDAEENLENMRSIIIPAHFSDSVAYYHTAAWNALVRGKLNEFSVFAEAALDNAEKSGNEFYINVMTSQIAKARLYQGRAQEALEISRKSRTEAQRLQTTTSVYLSWLTEYEIHDALGDYQSRLAALRHFLEIANQYNVRNHTGWIPLVMSRLYAEALQHQIEPDYVRSMIRQRNLLPPDDTIVPDTWPYPVKLYTLGRFTVLVNDKPLAFTGKTQKKPLELLRALIALGARDIPESQLIEALWPDTEGDLAKLSLNAAVHRLRKLLGNDVLLFQGGKLTLDPRYCWVDLWSVERTLTALSSALQQDAIDNSIQHSERLFTLYRGGFLEREPEAPWLLTTRERLRSRFVRELQNTANTLLAHNEVEHAIRCCEKALAVEPLAEALYRGLIRAHLAGNQPAEALLVYERCRRTLKNQLGIAPAAETMELVREIRGGK